jgi:hypothetical protein
MRPLIARTVGVAGWNVAVLVPALVAVAVAVCGVAMILTVAALQLARVPVRPA